MTLTNEAVEAVVKDSLFRTGEVPAGVPPPSGVKVDGIVSTFYFHPERLEANRAKVAELLAELPDEFHTGKGGGWSFLQACTDRHGNQWTGEHRQMEGLFALGIGLGLAQFCTSRDLWPIFPGGMPYVQVTLPKKEDE